MLPSGSVIHWNAIFARPVYRRIVAGVVDDGTWAAIAAAAPSHKSMLTL